MKTETIAQADKVAVLIHKAHATGKFDDKRQAFIECSFLYTLMERELLDIPMQLSTGMRKVVA